MNGSIAPGAMINLHKHRLNPARIVLLCHPPYSPALPDRKSQIPCRVFHDGKYNRLSTARSAKARFSVVSSLYLLLFAVLAHEAPHICDRNTSDLEAPQLMLLIR